MLDATVESTDADEVDIEAGTQIGRFVVLSRLGAGGMGQVFEAYDRELDRRVAVKVLHERRSASADAQTRLLREAQALARLSHPHVVSVYDVGRHEGQVYIAMEFIQGQTLGDWLEGAERPWTDILRVFVDVASGLQAIHELGFVHRDVKPENVLIDAEGRPRIIDFGLARAIADAEEIAEGEGIGGLFDTPLTQTGAMVGTPRYMSPEQYQRQPVTPASDQFSFCVALYESLYGMAPFLGKTFTARAAAVLEEDIQEPSDLGLPGEILEVVKRGLRRDPPTRWASMEELADLLHNLVSSHDPELDDPEEARRRRIVLMLVVVMILAVPGLFTGLFMVKVLPFTPATHAAVDGLTVLSFGLVLFLTRALWSKSRLGRRLSWYAMMIAVGFVSQSFSGWAAGRDPEQSALVNLVTYTVASFFAVSFVHPLVRIGGVIGVVGCGVAMWRPDLALACLNLTTASSVAAFALLAPRRIRLRWISEAASSTGTASGEVSTVLGRR